MLELAVLGVNPPRKAKARKAPKFSYRTGGKTPWAKCAAAARKAGLSFAQAGKIYRSFGGACRTRVERMAGKRSALSGRATAIRAWAKKTAAARESAALDPLGTYEFGGGMVAANRNRGRARRSNRRSKMVYTDLVRRRMPTLRKRMGAAAAMRKIASEWRSLRGGSKRRRRNAGPVALVVKTRHGGCRGRKSQSVRAYCRKPRKSKRKTKRAKNPRIARTPSRSRNRRRRNPYVVPVFAQNRRRRRNKRRRNYGRVARRYNRRRNGRRRRNPNLGGFVGGVFSRVRSALPLAAGVLLSWAIPGYAAPHLATFGITDTGLKGVALTLASGFVLGGVASALPFTRRFAPAIVAGAALGAVLKAAIWFFKDKIVPANQWLGYWSNGAPYVGDWLTLSAAPQGNHAIPPIPASNIAGLGRLGDYLETKHAMPLSMVPRPLDTDY